MPVPALEVDPVALEGWQRAQTAAREVVDPLAALSVEADDIASKVQASWEWQTRFAPWLGEQLGGHRDHLNFLEDQRIRTVRQMYRFEYVLDSLIRTHPRSDLLLRTWHQQVPLLIDKLTEVPDDLTESQKEDALAWQDVVKHCTQLIGQAAARDEKHQKQDDD